ncbi:MAG: sigma 54-interacting transcriptional regulator, partial [[Clostridium] innocuum]
MSDNTIKQGILELLERECSILDFDKSWSSEELEVLTAAWLSDHFQCSRNLISHYMSELQQRGQIIKINTRPVYFFLRKTLEERFFLQLQADIYETLDEMRDEVRAADKKHAFLNLIGAQDSLSYVVEQCKAAVSYPDHGLPILLQGPTGTGKSLIAQLMFQYGLDTGILPSDSRFVTVNCSEYANNPEMLMTNLFGYKKGAYTGAEKDTLGLLALADGGILFMDEVHGLKPECQEKIFLFMDKGIYHMVGDNDNWYESKARLIFATTMQPSEVLLKTLLRRIPLLVKVPSLAERPLQEKRRLLQYLIQEEEQHIQREICLSDLVYRTLERHVFIGNVGGLKNCIRASVAKAFLRSQDKQKHVELHLYDLPSDLLESSGKDLTLYSYDDKTMICSSEMLVNTQKDGHLYKLNSYMIHKYRTMNPTEPRLSVYVESCCLKLEQYVDYLFAGNTYESPKLDMMNHLVKNIMNIVIHKYHLEKFSNNEISILVHFMNDYMQNYASINQLRISNRKDVEQLQNLLHREYGLEYEIVCDIWQLVSDALNFVPGPFGFLDLFLFIRYFDREMQAADIPAVIIAHGYAIASGIAEVANQLLKQRVFDAIDMPIESDFDVIVKKLSEYLKGKESSKEIIVLVDMGSLEDIYQRLESVKLMDIGIINNVTTKLALDIGSMILEKMAIQDILREASSHLPYHYKIIKNRVKQDAVLSVCETGIGTAEKISNLMEASLPEHVSISVIPYDFDSLIKSGRSSSIFEKYNILFIVGTKNPKIAEI